MKSIQPFFCVLYCLLAGVYQTGAQISFTAAQLTYTQNFNSMSGTALPAGFVMETKNSGTAALVDNIATSLAVNSTGSAYKFSHNNDHSVGFLNSGSFTTGKKITATLINNTGAAITNLKISFSYKKYRSGSRAWDMVFSAGKGTLQTIAAGGNSWAANGDNAVTYFPPQVTVMPAFDIAVNIAPGDTYTLQWTLNGSGGSSNGQAIGVDDIAIKATTAGPSCTPVTVQVADTVCSSQLPVVWHGKTISQGGAAVAADTLTTVGGCDSVVVLDLLVNQTPVLIPVADKNVCHDEEVAVIRLANGVSDTSYTWVNNQIATGIPASGADSIDRFTATNTTGVPDTSRIITTATYAGCAGEPDTFLVVVNPTPTVHAAHDLTVCSGGTVVVSFSGAIAGTDYAWTNSNPVIGLAAAGNGDIPSYTARNYTIRPVSGTIVVTPSANGCTGVADTFTLTVNPVLTGTDINTICSSQLPYTWRGRQVTTGGAAAARDTLVHGTGCDSIITLELIVNPVSATTQTVSVCTGDLPYTWNGIRVTRTGAAAAVFTTANAAGCDSVVTLNLIEEQVVTPKVNMTVTPGAVVSPGTPVTFAAWVSDAGTNPVVTWYLNGEESGTGISFTSDELVSGDEVYCKVKSALACARPDTVLSRTVEMEVAGNPSSVRDIAVAGVRLYPNPNKGLFAVAGQVAGTTAAVDVFSQTGQLICHQGDVPVQAGQLQAEIRLENAPAAVYLLCISSGGTVQTIRFAITE